MTKSDFIRKTVLFIPSVIVMFFALALFALLFGKANTGNIQIMLFLKKVFSSSTLDVAMRSLPFLGAALVFSLLLGFLFSLPKHSSISDMWMSLFHGIFVSVPVFLFLFLVILIFSDILKLIPKRGIYDLTSMIAPVTGLSLLFAFYLSFKVRYHKGIRDDISGSNVKKTFAIFSNVFSSEAGIFLSMFILTEFFFYSGGIGYAIGYSIQKKDITGLSIYFIYVSILFLILRYLFSVVAFLTYKQKDSG